MDKAVSTILNMKTQGLAEKAFRLLVVVVWAQDTILGFVVQIVRRLPIIGAFYEYVIPMIIIGLTLFSLPLLLRRVRASDIAFYLICAVVVLGTMALNFKNSEYIKQDLLRILVSALPMLFIGVTYSHEDSKSDLFWASLFGAAAVFLYQLYVLSLGYELNADNMDTAYKVLPSVMYLIYWALEHKKLWHWIIAGISMVMMFLFGTRGPIVAEIVFLLFGLFFSVLNRKSQIAKRVWLIVFAVALVFICSGDNLIKAAEFLSEKFEDIGFSTRVFDRFIEGEIAEGSGRDTLYAAVKSAISEKPIFGYGLMGDRPIVDIYVHNVFLEMWCHFGVIFGTLILGFFVLVPVRAILRSKDVEERDFLVMMFCLVLVKLMLSSSYLYEANLFMMLGVSLAILRKRSLE